MSLCPNCGHQNIDGVDHCEACESSLTTLSKPRPKTSLERSVMKVPVRDLSLREHAVRLDQRLAVLLRLLLLRLLLELLRQRDRLLEQRERALLGLVRAGRIDRVLPQRGDGGALRVGGAIERPRDAAELLSGRPRFDGDGLRVLAEADHRAVATAEVLALDRARERDDLVLLHDDETLDRLD